MAGTAPSAKPKTFAEPTPSDSLWIGYPIPAEAATDLVLPGGQAAEQLHLTLAYLGKLESLADDAPDRARAAIEALSFAATPVPIHLNGIARFAASESSDGKDVLYATVQSDELWYLRERLCNALYAVGLFPLTHHEYVPHVTLAYVDPDSDPVTATLPNAKLSLDTIAVTAGGETGLYPLRGLFLWSASEDGRTRLFSESRFVEPPEWLPLLPKAGTYTHPIYGTLELTRERLAAFAASINEQVYLPRIGINAEHTTDTGGAFGWIVAARQNRDGSIDVQVEWTDRGREALLEDRFLYTSAEWRDAWTDPNGVTHLNVITGCALTVEPFFKAEQLRPIAATDLRVASDPIAHPTPSAGADTTPPEVTMRDATNPGAGAAPPTTATDQAADVKALSERLTAIEAELTATKAAKESSDTALRQATDTIATMQREARRARFTDEVRGKSDANGHMWAGEVAANVSVLETLADAVGEDSDTFKAFVTQQRATAEQLAKSGLFTEIGSSQSGTAGGGAWERIEAEARKVAADERIPFQQAIGLVAERQPQLYAEYQAEQRRLSKEV